MSNKITYGFFDLVVVNGDSWTRVFTAWYHSMKETKKRKKMIKIDLSNIENRIVLSSICSHTNILIEHHSLAYHIPSGIIDSKLISTAVFDYAGVTSGETKDVITKFYRVINGIKQHNCTKWKSRLFIDFNDFPIKNQLLDLINSTISNIKAVDPITANSIFQEFSNPADLMILAWLYDKGAHLKAHFDSEKKEGKWNFLINCGASVHFYTKKYTQHPSNRIIIDWKETVLTNNDCFFMNGCELQHGFVGLHLTNEFPFRIGFSVRKRILPLTEMISKPYFYKKQLQSQPRWNFEK